MDEGDFDVIVVGTGLCESIAAAALSKAGFRVAHIDQHPYYGGDEASLSLDELVQWADTNSTSSRFSCITRSPDIPSQSRHYSICLCPSIIPSVGPIITSLVASGVAKYGGFRLLERVGVYDASGTVKTVPGSKEDVFKNKDMSLVDKRRLMRFLMFAAGDFEDRSELEGRADLPFPEFLKAAFSLNDEIAAAITYSLTYCVSPSDPTLPALLRIRRYLRALGRYGPSPFLVGHYGGAGDIAQGFCRSAAVSGGVYILGRQITSITHIEVGPAPATSKYTISLDDFPDPITCNVLISSSTHVPHHLSANVRQLPSSQIYTETQQTATIARCIAIIDQPLSFAPPPPSDETTDSESSPQTEIDTAVLVYPPSSLASGSATTAATVLITGEGSMSTPKGKWILYLSLPLFDAGGTTLPSPKSLLQPYLNATLALAVNASSTPPHPLFTTFYIQHPLPPPPTAPTNPSPGPADKTCLVPTPLPAFPLSEILDAAATHAEAVFWAAVDILRPRNGTARKKDGTDQSEEEGEGGLDEIESFWPASDGRDQEEEDEW